MQYIWQQPNWTSWQIALSNFLTVDSLCHEEERCINPAKHGLDFLDADMVLENPLRLEVDSMRNGECRKQAFAYVFEVLTVLTVAYMLGKVQRIINFRLAKEGN